MEKTKTNVTVKGQSKPDLGFMKLWNISFGFFGVQIAFALQSSNISRIFSTLGADPHQLGYFWLLPPLLGMIVQPLVGFFSDKTWTRFGRRIPYLFIGSAFAVAVMCLLPNAGNLGLSGNEVFWGLTGAMAFGLFALMFLDASINMAMQPFKMMVGDIVNEKQKAKAYSIQSLLCNAGNFVGFLFPIVLTWLGVSNTAPDNVVPDSVKWAFYGGSIILILCVIYTTINVKEYDPEQMARFREAELEKEKKITGSKASTGKRAFKVFAAVALVQFFCWAAFQLMWVRSNDAVSILGFNVDTTIPLYAKGDAYQAAGNWLGVLYAIQAVVSILWAMMIPRFKSLKVVYALSLTIGGVGFLLLPYCSHQYLLIIPYAMSGFAWAAMLALPFTLVTNALEGNPRMGTYLGLFNCTICLPQLVIAGTDKHIFEAVGAANNQPYMLAIAGISLLLGALSVFLIAQRKKAVAE